MTRSEVLWYRSVIEQSVQSLTNDVALTAVTLYPEWTPGVSYAAGFKVQRNGKLWRCVQAHTSLTGWEPENTASLWEQINETHAGTPDDPIPYGGNMALTSGLYYIQGGYLYCCIRDTTNPVYANLDDLVGQYVVKK